MRHLFFILLTAVILALPLSAMAADEPAVGSASGDVVKDTATVVTDAASGAMTVVSDTAAVENAASNATAAAGISPAGAETPPAKKEFIVFIDRFNLNNHYIPSGWMGDYGDIAIDDGCKIEPHGGKTCLKVSYSARGSQGAGWMGIYWQNPANNWGSQMGGFDLSGYNKVEFWARGEKGGETIAEFKIGGITGTYPDSDSTSIGPITLTKDWKKYEIDLKGLDLSYISGGFELSASSKDNPEGFVIYLDDIKYVE